MMRSNSNLRVSKLTPLTRRFAVTGAVALISTIVMSFGLYHSVLANETSLRIDRDVRYFSTPPAAQEIGTHLFPSVKIEENGRKDRNRRARSIAFTPPAEPAAQQKAVGMPVLFHFGKTSIVESSRAFLDSVGKMMVSVDYAEQTVIVEGHTDAVGSASHNQRLSELRALAIKEYLVNQFGIDPIRLFPSGKGESMLRKPSHPKNRVNRRVEFLPYQTN